nr:nucleotidyltransferase family protein [Novosphingobium sp. FKTRR1]
MAAGKASRFGADKLAAQLIDRPVARHAADMLAALPFVHRFAIVREQTPPPPAPLPGYTCLPLDPPDAPQSRSLATGVAAARRVGAQAVLVALADMPLVPASHIAALVSAFDGDRIASRDTAGTPMPPALFGARHFAALEVLLGDRGAGALLRDAPFVTLPPGAEHDIDTPDDLARAARQLGQAD